MGPTREELASLPERIIRYMAPMQGPGKPYREELVRRAENAGMFRDHRCWKCDDGTRPCVSGDPRQCDYPRARND